MLAICSLLSLVEAAFGDGEQNAASLRLVEGLTSAGGGLAAAVAEALGALDADDDFVERARPHVQMLLFTAAAKSDALQMAPSWWRLRVKLHFRAALRCRQLPQEDVVPELQPGDLLTQDFWRGALAKLRTFASSERSEEAQVEEVCAEALCRGLTVLEDLLPLKGQCADLAQAVWSLVMQPDSPASAFGLTRRLPGPLAKGLLRWLHMEPVKKVLPRKPMEPKTVQLLLGFLEDVTEPEPCSEEDLRLVQTTKCTPQLLAAAARLRRALCEYARSLAGAAEPPPLPKVLSDLLRLRSPALFAAKVLRRLGGDQELCRLAGLRLRLKGGLDWFPLDGARLPRLSDDLPDPFVPCAFQCIEHKEKKKMFQWFLNVCSAAGVLASSAKPDAASFDKAVKQASAGLFPRAGAVVACVASRVLMNRQVASQEGLSELGTWLEQRLEAANAVRKRAKVLLMQRMCSSLLPHLEELGEEGEDAPPRRFLEQLALLLCVLAIDSNGTSASWLELALMAPNDAQRTFWPTMPDSEEAAVLGAMGFVGWYTCRNGHPYSVGECTRPMQQGVCPVAGCGARIGGEHHVNVQGVKTVKQESLIKKATPGYIAATSDLIDQTILNQFNRQLNMRGLQSLRLLVHVTLWASLSSEGAARAAEAAQPGCRGDVRSAAAHLHSQIVEEWKDLRRRTRLPGRELGAWLHLSVLRCTKFAASRLSTEEERLKFEADFQIAGEQAVLTALTGEDRKQMDVGTDYTAAAAAGFGDDWKELCDRWEPSVYDTMETALPAALWHGRACVTLEEFEESFLSRLENRRAHPVLAVVLKQRRRLGALPALPALLAWHAVLFEAFEDYALTREDARQLTHREAIERLPEHRRPEATKRLQSFCEHFNRAFPLVERLFECEANPFLVKGEVNLPGAMTPDTPVIFSLPYVAQAGETEAPSLCTVQLANVLQTAQNDLVEALDPGDRTVPLSSSTAPKACSALLASLDLQADLLPLLHQYRDDLSNGLDYDLAGLEEALARRLRGAVRIQVQLRHFRFGGELKDSGRLAILRQKLPQEPLPFGMAEELQRELQRSESLEAARQLRALLEDCIHLCLSLGSFGSAGKAAVQAQTPLAELLGASGQAEALPAALRSAKLCHLQDLYMELVRSNDAGDALAGVALAYQEPLEDELLAELQKSAEELAEWLPVLHDLLAEQLVVDRFPPGSSLKEFLGFAAGEDPPECFPEQLELRHALAVHRALERAQS
ncbi:unnamed protein product [Effrenium voratum]|nr:unnamed protein product [Effrenium voratum]